MHCACKPKEAGRLHNRVLVRTIRVNGDGHWSDRAVLPALTGCQRYTHIRGREPLLMGNTLHASLLLMREGVFGREGV
jgi:hypothetical protein